MTRSIRLRLVAWILALLLPVSVAAGWLLVQVFADRLLRDIDVALEEEAETIAALALNAGNDDALAALLTRVAAETDLGTPKRIVVSRAGRVIGDAPSGAAMQPEPAADAIHTATYQVGPPEDPVTVVISVPVAQALHAQARLTVLLALGIPCALLVIAAGLWVVTGRALKPLEAASRQLEAIDAERLAARVPVANPHDEVGRMVVVLNRMLDRVESAVGEMRRFSADAAHELRTPLAVLRTGLDVALSRPRSADEYRAALAEALESTDRLSRVAEELLTLARMETHAERRRLDTIDLTEMLHELADAWASPAAQRGVTVELVAPPDLAVHGSAADLYRLFGNLIDNAVRYSPRGGRVALSAAAADGHVEVSIADRGPGLAPGEAERVFERFYRGHDAPSGGSGLGLSIAQAIVRAHGGRVTLGNRDGGGCIATVVLPCDAASA
jgi:signal transduction histidine kinase